MFAVWLHTVGSRIIALPFRIVIGLVFLYQGYLNAFGGDQAVAKLLNLDYLLGPTVGNVVGFVMIIAGLAAILGIFVRIIAAALCAIVIINLPAAVSTAATEGGADVAIATVQNGGLLAMCSAVLFFLGSGIFSLDNMIFKGVSSVLADNDKDAMEKARQQRGK